MKKADNIATIRNSPFFRRLIGVVAALLVTVKLASPFLHTHQFSESSSKGVSITSIHCNACDFEATQAIEPGVAIVLPSGLFGYESKSFQTQSVFLSTVHSSSESRGPPLHS